MDYNNMNNWPLDRDSLPRSGNYGFGDDGGWYGQEEVVSVGTWIGILILLAIPIVNFIALLVIAFSDINTNIKNYAKAVLIIFGIGLLLALLLRGCTL